MPDVTVDELTPIEAVHLSRTQGAALGAMLVLYLAARLCQLEADRLPTLLIVLLHVLPPAVFALVHGSVLYGRKGMAVFTVCCLGVATLFESVSLRIGLPYGHYYFTGVMGPQIAHLPVLLVCAYLGIGYVSWVLALLILGYSGAPLRGVRTFALPMLASVVMTTWDLAMDPDWSTLDRAWVWRDGGAYFGVPVSNYIGWLITTYLFYQLFALYLRREGRSVTAGGASLSRPAILLYAICAGGNLLLFAKPMALPVVADASGRQWNTMVVLTGCALVSVLGMGSFVVLSWIRMRKSLLSAQDLENPLSSR